MENRIPPCQIIRSSRKSISVRITPQNHLQVRCPYYMTDRQVRAFLEEKSSWIQAHLNREPAPPVFTPEELEALSAGAKQVIPEKVRSYAARIGVTYGRITIRRQKTRWGSCSAAGSLNFNCLLLLAPEEVLDYVIVHELCHRRQMNHSPAFWRDVETILPDYRERRLWLKQHGATLIARLPA